MKVLDAENLHAGIDDIKREIHHFQSQITSIQKAVRGITTLHESLKGKGGEAIRAFYNECHQPFLIYMYNFLIDYEEILDQMKQAVLSYEPETSGMIRQDFLENDVTSGLEKVKNVTTGLTDEANSVMDSVQDIVALPKLDDEEFLHHVQRGKKRTKDTVEQLHDLDNSQTKALEPIEEQLRTMNDYIADIQSVFTNGEITLHNIDIHTVASIGFYQNMLTDTPITYAALRKQNQFNRVAGPYVMMMYPNMLFPITYRNYSAGNVHLGDISKQKPIKEAAEQYKLTDPESIAIANYLRREYTDEPEIDVQEMESQVNVESPQSSDNMYYSAREPLTFWDKREVVGGYSDLAGDPFMMGHIATAGFNFAFDDIGTMIDPDATAEDKMMAGLFLFAKPLKAADKVVGGANRVDKVRDAGKVDKGVDNPLLPGEGKVGTYEELIDAGTRGDNITPHHMPSAKYMKTKAEVHKNDGVSMNMEHPHPGKGGRHRQTETYGMTGKKLEDYLNLEPRDALARDIIDARNNYIKEGLYTPEIRSGLLEVIKLNKTKYPNIFDR
ncbi:ribonuclease YeeF family protein [Lentibacillus sp. Marseille-P4043]|uniref:ribonuclease YeeF family protein n=1 Tax=Lentibacillus sp. Marseille-P4043 TaxID=2040293 RepID=UPI00131A4EBF|nr:LXG domain-containing protein [Lentibacillus sp. Marseille-P4043]